MELKTLKKIRIFINNFIDEYSTFFAAIEVC